MIWHLFASRNNLSVRKSSKTWEKMGFCVSPKMVSDPPLCKWISRKAKKTYSIAVIGYFDDFKQFGEQTVQSSSQCTWNCAILCLFKRENSLLCAWNPGFLRTWARYECKWSICFIYITAIILTPRSSETDESVMSYSQTTPIFPHSNEHLSRKTDVFQIVHRDSTPGAPWQS